MAYKRPLSKNQSIFIAILWLVFFIIFLRFGIKNIFTCLAIMASAFVTFYPIWKSLRERKEKSRKDIERKHKQELNKNNK